MAIVNKRNGSIIARKFKIRKNILQQAKGLMFSGKNNLLFDFGKEKRTPLHMFFVFFPIDVMIVDDKKKVVEIKENFRPFTIYNPKHKGRFLIEVPAGVVSSTNTRPGDMLEIRA